MGQETSKNIPADNVAAKGPSAKVQSKDRDMGSALRSAYQRTVDEAIPDDLLDLLGKLG